MCFCWYLCLCELQNTETQTHKTAKYKLDDAKNPQGKNLASQQNNSDSKTRKATPAPLRIPAAYTDNCMRCDGDATGKNRLSCANCGYVICSNCSGGSIPGDIDWSVDIEVCNHC